MPRDRELMRFLFESKAATSRQIYERFFPGVSERMAYRRVAQLVRSGWITRLGHSDGRRLYHAHSLTDAGYRQYVQEEGDSGERRRLQSNSLDHDLALVDLRRRFERVRFLTRYLTENVLQFSGECREDLVLRDYVDLRSDAVIELQLRGEDRLLLPLEYEASFKSKERCQERLRGYYERSNAAAVLWVCGSDALARRIHETDLSVAVATPPKMYVATWAEAFSSAESIRLTNAKGKALALRLDAEVAQSPGYTVGSGARPPARAAFDARA